LLNKKLLFLLLLPVLLIPVYAQEDTIEIPSWVKGVANFWVEDKINDVEFAEALEFLIDSNIIQLGITEYKGMSELEAEITKLTEEKTELQTKYDTQEVWWQGVSGKSEKDWGEQSAEYKQKLTDNDTKWEGILEKKRTSYNTQAQEFIDEIRELKIEIQKLEYIIKFGS